MLISIIIPIYNAGHLLHRCIDSILTQIYKDWELVLVDDGSTDDSGDICEYNAMQDSRIRVLHKTNGGVSSARNMGLDNAKGERICFIDADDYISEDYLASMAYSEADLVVCGFRSSEGITYKPERCYLDSNQIGYQLKELLINDYSLFVPWIKLIKKEIIDTYNIRFDTKLKLSEDTMFVYDYLSHCKTIEYVSNTSYFYEGVFGGAGKYNLTWDEMTYMHKSEIERRYALLEKFPNSQDILSHVCPRITRTTGLLENHKLSECYELWKQSFLKRADLNETYFYTKVFSVATFLVGIVSHNNIDIVFLRNIKKFCDVDNKFVKADSMLDRFICIAALDVNVSRLKKLVKFRNALKVLNRYFKFI